MNPLQRLSLRASTALFTSVATVAIVALGVLSLLNMNASEAVAQRVLSDVALTRAAGSADMMHDALRGDTLAAQLAGPKAPEERRKAIADDLTEHVKTMDEEMAHLERAASSAAVRAALAKVKPAVTAYTKAAAQLVAAALAGPVDASQAAEFDNAFGELETHLGALSTLVEQSTQAVVEHQSQGFARSRWTLGLSVLAGTLLLALFGWSFVRSTLTLLGAEPMRLRALSLRIADGHLGERFDQAPPQGSVADAMLRMQSMLSDTVCRIRANAETVASASQQLAQGNQDLSQRTEEQASSLEQTAASPSGRTPSAPSRPTGSPPAPARWRCAAATWSARWCRR
jgi:methyl-accepting chemotaxis protein